MTNYQYSDNLINDIIEDSQGRVWVAGYNGSLSRSVERINETSATLLQFENLEKEIELGEKDLIRSIFEDDKGFIWFGTDLSWVVYNPYDKSFKKIKLINKGQIIQGREFRSFVQIDQNKVILGGSQIIILENPWEKIKKERNPEIQTHSILDLGQESVQEFLLDTLRKLWFGTQYGLYEIILGNNSNTISAQKVTIDGETIKLSNPKIFCLHEDSSQRIWIGTFGGGLNKLIFLNKPTFDCHKLIFSAIKSGPYLTIQF